MLSRLHAKVLQTAEKSLDCLLKYSRPGKALKIVCYSTVDCGKLSRLSAKVQ